MKMRLVLLALAAVLIGWVQEACGFYNPSTGRWLSRDPIGELGFELVAGRPKSADERILEHLRATVDVLRQNNLHLAGKIEEVLLRMGIDVGGIHGSPNLYGFVLNDPNRNVDIFGLQTFKGCMSKCINERIGDAEYFAIWLAAYAAFGVGSMPTSSGGVLASELAARSVVNVLRAAVDGGLITGAQGWGAMYTIMVNSASAAGASATIASFMAGYAVGTLADCANQCNVKPPCVYGRPIIYRNSPPIVIAN